LAFAAMLVAAMISNDLFNTFRDESGVRHGSTCSGSPSMPFSSPQDCLAAGEARASLAA
jgi:hypothetical protein